ncbi:peroxiredoxin family protein [Cytobacillus firmus]|uniref:peroxiredoxin family protein n=1 Tax=Cytobacillus firmus TaxID=1399 RepID=UPI00077C2C04|nr:peroxiredoxin family protein [Cytobacillus firmus]MBG9543215.1 peroxiredoxin family protein [Cytobacillus firmus]MBG9552974.1 peroxiredoxin family protein [Cytobacillus firmus]MBG9556020.1 peroxiredoxin family protein [Cytobacillus firmus]MBG9575641.1 peroxiredoxin family protein [Cytobacillus firmus]MEC1895243.1 peroxiredoxin family protein [Cytobacillus firmus]
MESKKVVVLALHDELESAYPPLNVAVGAAASGADVILAFSRKGVNILDRKYFPVPSKGIEYLSNALNDFGAPSIHELLDIAVEMGVRLYVVDMDIHDKVNLLYPAEQVPIKWVLNEDVSADLFVHF